MKYNINMKLKDIPKVFVINLPDRVDRKANVIKTFKDYGITNYSFVPGVYSDTIYSDDNISNNMIIGKTFNAGHTNKESSLTQQAVMIAHINAIKEWVAENSDEEYAIIMEDDVSFYPVDRWNWTWSEFQSRVPEQADIVQLCILKIDPKEYSKIKFEHRVRRSDYASAAAYLISKSYAKELLSRHTRDSKYVFEAPAGMNSVADELLYDSDNAYACPLFLFDDSSGSSQTLKEHLDAVHYPAKMHMIELWNNIGKATLDDIWNR
jgi:GR25 family glycosyltransferase involved in LPS biosynthesis